MRVLYSTCWVDPWIKVAKQLKIDFNLDPIYWIGFYEDNSKKLVPEEFPNVHYHSRWDAWKCIFPAEVEKSYTKYNLSPDFLREIAIYELQGMTLMDRLTPDRYSFAFSERQRVFRNFLRKWMACIDIFNIEFVIGDRIPHRTYDYTLYIVCKYLGIKYIYSNHVHIPNRIMYLTSLQDLTKEFLDSYNAISKSNENKKVNEIKINLENDVSTYYDNCKATYDKGQPYFMEELDKGQRQHSNIFKIGFSFLKEFFGFKKNNVIYNRPMHGLIKDFFDVHPYSKKRNKLLEESKYNAFQYGLNILKANRYRKKLKKFYNKNTVTPDFNKPYIYFALHYQPEATSSPSADIFVDQYLAIEQIAVNIPGNWVIYVKEHIHQFNYLMEGQKGRFLHLYKDLMKISNVAFVPLNTDSFALIDNAKAVSTLTGTVGWEAIVRNKPLIVFGLTWYQACYGVLKIINTEDVSKINDFINNYLPNEKAVINYLLAMQKFAPLTYSYRADLKENISEKQCVNNTILQLSQFLEKIKNTSF